MIKFDDKKFMVRGFKKLFNGSRLGGSKTRRFCILRFKVVGMNPEIAKEHCYDVGCLLDSIKEFPAGMIIERPIFNNTGVRVAVYNEKLIDVKSVIAFLKKCGLDVVLLDSKIRQNRLFGGVSYQIG